jgi:hypothetical protein
MALPTIAQLHGLSLVEAIDQFCVPRLTLIARKVRKAKPRELPPHQGSDEQEYNTPWKAILRQGQNGFADTIAAQRWTRFSPNPEFTQWAARDLNSIDYQTLAREIVATTEVVIGSLCNGKLIAIGVLEPAASSGFEEKQIPPGVFRVGRWTLYRNGSRLVNVDHYGRETRPVYSQVRIAEPPASRLPHNAPGETEPTRNIPPSPLAHGGKQQRAVAAKLNELRNAGVNIELLTDKQLYRRVIENWKDNRPGISTVMRAAGRKDS